MFPHVSSKPRIWTPPMKSIYFEIARWIFSNFNWFRYSAHDSPSYLSDSNNTNKEQILSKRTNDLDLEQLVSYEDRDTIEFSTDCGFLLLSFSTNFITATESFCLRLWLSFSFEFVKLDNCHTTAVIGVAHHIHRTTCDVKFSPMPIEYDIEIGLCEKVPVHVCSVAIKIERFAMFHYVLLEYFPFKIIVVHPRRYACMFESIGGPKMRFPYPPHATHFHGCEFSSHPLV